MCHSILHWREYVTHPDETWLDRDDKGDECGLSLQVGDSITEIWVIGMIQKRLFRDISHHSGL
jgi:hypothetical protein